jgi:uncharacterized protein YjiS (DUF1127 family)
MANLAFVADNTIPGLSAAELTRRAVNAVELSCQGLASCVDNARRQRAVRESLRGLDAHQLRDIGLDRSGL